MPDDVLQGTILDQFHSEREIWLRGDRHNAEERTPKVGNCAVPAVQLNRQEIATELLQSRPSPDKDRQSGDPTAFLGGGEDCGVSGTGLKSSWPNSPRYVHLGEHVTEESLA